MDERTQDRAIAAGLAALAVLAHLPDLGGGFLADDFQQLAGVTTAGAADLGKSLGWFVQPLPGVDPPLPPDVDPRFWRPLLFASLGADFSVFGARPLGFHAVDVAVHAGVVVALFGLLRRWDRGLAVAAAALFAAWPGGHEAVPWISARCGPMALLGTIGALWAFEARRPLVAAALTSLALLSKETAMIAPPLLTVFALLRPTGRVAALRRTAPTWLAFAVYLAFRHRMLGQLGGGYAVHDASIFSPSLWPGRLETLRTLLGPLKSFHVGAAAQGGLAATTALLLAIGLPLSARHRPDLRGPMAATGLWFAGSLVPMHDLTVFGHVHPDARFLYEPGAPLCVLLAQAGIGLLDRAPRRIGAAVLALAVLASAVAYRGNARDRAVATDLSLALRGAAEESARIGPGARHVFVDVPRSFNGVALGNNTFPWALAPPFWDGPTPAGVEVLFADSVDPARLGGLARELREEPGLFAWVWDERARGFRRMWPK